LRVWKGDVGAGIPHFHLFSSGHGKAPCSTTRQRNTKVVTPGLKPLGSYTIQHAIHVSYGMGQTLCT